MKIGKVTLSQEFQIFPFIPDGRIDFNAI